MKKPHRVRNAIIWSVLGLVIFISGIVILGALNDADGDPLLQDPGAVIVAIIGATAVLLTPVIPWLLKLERNSEIIKENTIAAREQLENDHRDEQGNQINMRYDLDQKPNKEYIDEKHDELTHKLEVTLAAGLATLSEEFKQAWGSLDKRIFDTASDIRGLRRDNGRVMGKLDTFEERLDDQDKAIMTVQNQTSTIQAQVESMVDTITGSQKTHEEPK